MSKVILDIETIGFNFEKLDKVSQDYILKFSESEEDKQLEKQKLALWAPTAQVIVIGLLNPDTNKGVIYFQNNDQAKEEFTEGEAEYKSGSEKEILEYFWQAIKHYDQFITFNGRGFDCPFLMIRSAILGIKATKNLMPYRYNSDFHVDLLEQLTFYSAVRKFNMDFFCKAFGIKSPKSEITGLDLPRLYEAGEYLRIVKYNLGDLIATKELYEKWNSYINIK